MLCKDLYEKIRNADCTEEELSDLLSKAYELEKDCQDPFKEYYSVDNILRCIDLYKSRKVSDSYLAHWANVYGYLILCNDGSKSDKALTWQDLVEYDIADWLDGLSFYEEESDDENYIDHFRRAFEVLDGIYRNLDEWQAHLGYSNVNILTAVAVNDTKGKFVRLYFAGMDETFIEHLFEKPLSDGKLKRLVKALKKNGYSEVIYWPDNDIVDEIEDE